MGEVFQFELHYRLRQPTTWLYAALLLVLPFLMLHAVDGGDVKVNSPEIVMTVSAVLGIVGMLVTAAFFGDAAIRDTSHGAAPLFYTTPLREVEYLGGRFLAALLINAVVLAGIPLGMAIGSFMPYLPEEMFGPFRAAAYVQPYVLLLLPNLVLTASVLFAVAALTRQTMATYLAGIALFVGYIFAGRLHESLADRTVAALVDPFGILVVEELARYWPVVEQNTRLIGFPALLVWNRVIWVGVASAILLALIAKFRFEHHAGGGRSRKRGRQVTDPGLQEVAPVMTPGIRPPVVDRAFGVVTRSKQALWLGGHALRQVLSNRAVLLILVGLGILGVTWGRQAGAIVFGTATWPVTHLMAGTALTVPFQQLVPILIVLLAGELVWRDRDVGVNELVGSAPLPDWMPLTARFLALAALLIGLQALLIPLGVALQTYQGYYAFELGLYVRILFGFGLPNYLLFAAVALAVHVVADHKYLGHLIVVLFYLFTVQAGTFGIEHNLLIFGSDPGWVYSDMSGFGPFVGPFVWFKLYWAGWALLLAVGANLLWVRGTERGLRRRLERARAGFTRWTAGAAGLAVLLILTFGGFIFYNTNVLNDYRTRLESNALRAEYERRYQRFADVGQPQISRVELRVEIYPDERTAELRGGYVLVNDTGEPIDSVHVVTSHEVTTNALGFREGAAVVHQADEIGYRIFALPRPLQPGDSTRLEFDLTFRPVGFPNTGIPTDVVRNGAYFERGWLPIIGYQSSFELSGAQARREQGLEPRPPPAPPTDPAARREPGGFRDADLVHMETVIGTDDDQIAVTVGELVDEWREDGRRYFHYRTETPVGFGAPVLSANYDVLEDRWGDVALEIFHHPSHTFNLDRMVGSMKASLDYFTTRFGPYRYPRLRIVEFPRYASFARAHPHTITFSEGGAFLTRVEEGDVDRPFFVVAHETAHQWWGGQVRAGRAAGAAFLSESLAQYSAMMVMETTYGPEQVRRFYDYEMDRYLHGRRIFANREMPLLEVEDQSFLYYHKGAVALYTLRDFIGADALNTALRQYYETFAPTAPPYPTSLDLYRELQAVTPDTLQGLLVDLFEEVTLWEVRTLAARAEPTADGEYRITLEVEARKLRADSAGNQTDVPMNDLVEVGVFAPAEPGGRLGEPIYLERHRIRTGRQTITVTVDAAPARAGIDPYRKLIQRERPSNAVEVEVGAG